MSWKEVVVYSVITAASVIAGGLKIVDSHQVGEILVGIATFVIGRGIPTKKE